MSRMFRIVVKDTILQCYTLKSSSHIPKVSTIGLVTKLQPVSRFCCGCGRNEILFQKRGPQHLESPSIGWQVLGRSFCSQIVALRRLHRFSERHKLYKMLPALEHNLSKSRNVSITSRAFLATTASSSAASSTQTASALVVDTSSSRETLLSDFFPVYGAERAIEYIHQFTGLPWWSTIVLTAFILRVVLLLPITIHSFHNIAKLQNLHPEVMDVAERLKKEVAIAMHQFKWDEKRAQQEYKKNMNRLLKKLYIRDNCHPLKGVATFWIQIPMWISVTYALRNLSLRAVNPDLDGHTEVKSMSEQGLAWFPDLTVTDSTWLLPLMMGTVTLVNIEINYLSIPDVTKYRKWLTYGLRGLALIFIPISSTMPSSMVLYWVCSGMFGAVQNLVFDYSPFRRLIGLPKTNIESHSPLKALRQRAMTRYWKS